jgi:hypothetical protein
MIAVTGRAMNAGWISEWLRENDSVLVKSVSVSTCSYTGRSDISLELSRVAGEEFELHGWIKASLTKPKDDIEVLVCRDGVVSVASYWGPEDGWSIDPPPTHWMPTPPPVMERPT